MSWTTEYLVQRFTFDYENAPAVTVGYVVDVTISGGGASLATTTPAALGTAAVGVGTTAARADHVHAMPTSDDVVGPIQVYVRVATSITALGGTVGSGTVTCAALNSIPTGEILWLTNDGADSGFYTKSATNTFTETTDYLSGLSHLGRVIVVSTDLEHSTTTLYNITAPAGTAIAVRVSVTPAQMTALLAEYPLSVDAGWMIAATDEPAQVLRFTGVSPGVNDGAFVTPNLGNITTSLDFQVRCKPTGPPPTGAYAELLTQTHDSHVGAWDNFEAALLLDDGSFGDDAQWLMFYEHTAEGGTVEVVPPDGIHVADANLHTGVWSTLRWNHDLTTGTISFYREVAYGGVEYDGRRWRSITSWTYSDAESIDNGVTEEWHLGLRFVGDIEWARIHIDGALVAAPAATDGAVGDLTITDSESVVWESATAMVVSNVAGGSGDVVGPASVTASRPALFDGTTGKLLKQGSAIGAALADASSAAAARQTLEVRPGVEVQAYDEKLAVIAGVTPAADAVPYFTATGPVAASTFTVTSAARSLLDDTTVAAMRTTLGVPFGVVADRTIAASGSASESFDVTGLTMVRVIFAGNSERASAQDTLRMTLNADSSSVYSTDSGALTTFWSVGAMPGQLTNADRAGWCEAELHLLSGFVKSGVGRATNIGSTAAVGQSIVHRGFFSTITAAVTSLELVMAVSEIAAGSRIIVLGA